MEIDLVYCWCSNKEEKYRTQQSKAKQDFLIEEDTTKADIRSTDHDELRYSLRSVEKYAPWIHNIYIVTSGQVPEWLDLNHPKITVVDDSEIVPTEYLPTFNSNVIEAFLYKIPGLSEHFLYACDDMMFTNKTTPDFFYTADGKPIHYVDFVEEYTNSYWANILNKAKLLAEKDTGRQFPSCVLPSHNIDPYTKTLYQDTVDHFSETYLAMYPNKFRKNNDVQRFLVSCWGMLTDHLIWQKVDLDKFGYVEDVSPAFINDFLSNPRPNLFCVNDSKILDENDYHYQAELLEALFPNKSSFEKETTCPARQDYFGLKPAFSENNIPVVFVINKDWLPYCAITLSSLLKYVSPNYNYDIIICHQGISDALMDVLKDIKLPQNVRIQTKDLKPCFEKMNSSTPLWELKNDRKIKWAKVFLPQLLGHYSKVIYLDADLLMKCDVAELWHMDLEGKAVAGAVDMAAQHLDSNKKEYMDAVFHQTDIDDYINLGVMVMDLDALRRMEFTEQAIDLIANLPQKVWNLYDIFNVVLHENIKLLPIAYNCQYGFLSKGKNLYPYFKDELYLPFQKALQDGGKIVHFTAIKPWKEIIGKESMNWWQLAKTTDFYEMILMKKSQQKK